MPCYKLAAIIRWSVYIKAFRRLAYNILYILIPHNQLIIKTLYYEYRKVCTVVFR